jgi:hypothetical protein
LSGDSSAVDLKKADSLEAAGLYSPIRSQIFDSRIPGFWAVMAPLPHGKPSASSRLPLPPGAFVVTP